MSDDKPFLTNNIKVSTRVETDGTITQMVVPDLARACTHMVIATQEAHIRKGLKRLGWLSPEDAREMVTTLDILSQFSIGHQYGCGDCHRDFSDVIDDAHKLLRNYKEQLNNE